MKKIYKIAFAFTFLVGLGAFLTGCGSSATLEDAAAKKDEAVQSIYNRDLPGAIVALEEAETILQNLDATAELAAMKVETAEVYRYTKDLEQASNRLEEAVALFEKVENKEGMADAYNILGIIAKDQEKYDLALERYQNAADLYAEIESPKELIAKNNIADLFIQKEEYDEALTRVDEALDLARERELVDETALLTVTRGEIFSRQGDDEMALLHFQDAWDMVADSENQRIKSLAFQFMQQGHLAFNYYEPTGDTCNEETSEMRDGKCYCKPRFYRNWYRTGCAPLPDNAYFVNSKTDTWLCAPGTHEENNKCVLDQPPVAEEPAAAVPAEETTGAETPAE